MFTETIADIKFEEVQNPDGSGCTYYVRINDNLRIEVLNMGRFGERGNEVLAGLLHWRLAGRNVRPPEPVKPQPDFNKNAWSCGL